MTEKQIRERIKELETELKHLNSLLPKKELPKRKTSNNESSFLSMANEIVESRRRSRRA